MSSGSVKSKQQSFRGISQRAATLLSGTETLDAEWKKTIQQLDSEDLVAFANSANGGSILLGVEEVKGSGGLQQARVVGCPIGDSDKLALLNKARNCVPPIEIALFIENSAKCPFIRIEVGSGAHKPYCTAKGLYKIRSDGQNKPLLPHDLLAMFLELEGTRFLDRFRIATNQMEGMVAALKSRIENDLQRVEENISAVEATVTETQSDLQTTVGHLQEDIGHKIEEWIGGLGDNVESLLYDVSDGHDSGVGELVSRIEAVEDQLALIRTGQKSLLALNGLEDPLIQRYRTSMRHFLVLQLNGRLVQSDNEMLEFAHEMFTFDKGLIERLFREELDELRQSAGKPIDNTKRP